MADEFKAIETQEAFDAAIKARLERNTRTVTEEVAKQYEGWVSPADAQKQADTITDLTSQIEASKQALADMTAKAAAHELNSEKLKAAIAAGLPSELADRLTGDSVEEIQKDAERMSQLFGRRPTPHFTPEKPAGDAKTAALKEALHNIIT